MIALNSSERIPWTRITPACDRQAPAQSLSSLGKSDTSCVTRIRPSAAASASTSASSIPSDQGLLDERTDVVTFVSQRTRDPCPGEMGIEEQSHAGLEPAELDERIERLQLFRRSPLEIERLFDLRGKPL